MLQPNLPITVVKSVVVFVDLAHPFLETNIASATSNDSCTNMNKNAIGEDPMLIPDSIAEGNYFIGQDGTRATRTRYTYTRTAPMNKWA